jgi:hypothetical protein
MSLPKQIFELVEEIRELADRANSEDAKSALIYCIKQLKISAASRRQEEEDDDIDDDDDDEYEDDDDEKLN